jgi:hypothetical protein
MVVETRVGKAIHLIDGFVRRVAFTDGEFAALLEIDDERYGNARTARPALLRLVAAIAEEIC